jgi:hypothetical protein
VEIDQFTLPQSTLFIIFIMENSFIIFKAFITKGKPIGLHHPLDGVNNPEYKLLHFIQLTNFLQREEGTSF